MGLVSGAIGTTAERQEPGLVLSLRMGRQLRIEVGGSSVC